MSRALSELLDGFVLPLLGGGGVQVGAPLRLEDYREMAAVLPQQIPIDLQLLRQRQAESVIADPVLDDADADELALWIALHNVLVFDHPERARVWTRKITWRRVEAATRTLLSLSQTHSLAAALARHAAVGPFLELIRRDIILLTLEGEERYMGQPVPRRRLRFSHRDETVEWLYGEHSLEVASLMPDVLWASPITCLLRPLLAPQGWSPLIAAPLLLERSFARAVTYSWASSRQWIEIGGAVMSGLLASILPPAEVIDLGDETGESARSVGPRALGPGRAPLALPGSSFDAGPREIGALVGALIHLHVLKVLELGARLGVATATRERSVRMFLALPLLADRLAPILGEPLSPPGRPQGFDAQLARRWTEYTDHLTEVLPRDVVENLRATLVPRIVKEDP